MENGQKLKVFEMCLLRRTLRSLCSHKSSPRYGMREGPPQKEDILSISSGSIERNMSEKRVERKEAER